MFPIAIYSSAELHCPAADMQLCASQRMNNIDNFASFCKNKKNHAFDQEFVMFDRASYDEHIGTSYVARSL